MFAILSFVLLFEATTALIGYDCRSRSVNVTTISLLDVGQCQMPSNTLNVSRKYVQLLQVTKFVETQAI